MIRLKNGLELTEKDLVNWDNVPEEAEIANLGLAIPRAGGQPPYIFDVRGFEEICLARQASAAPGGATKLGGFVIFGVANNHVTELTIRTDGIGMKSYHRDALTLRPGCLRRMTTK